MMPAASDRPSSPPLKPIAVLSVMAFVLALRLAHLASAGSSPLSYQPGPDEEYYLRFGQAVAAGVSQDSPEFTFMDPAYGYLLGVVFKLTGGGLFIIYALQCLLDTATAYGILVIGRLLGRPRAGLYGALLYGMASVAIMFCTALLKEVWVTAFVTWWVAGALRLTGSRSRLGWMAFGLYCGLGVALRSTLLLLAFAALALPLFKASPGAGTSLDAEASPGAAGFSRWARGAAPMVCGLVLALLPWSFRNHQAYGGLSPLPHNGGVVLHQVYNEKNSESAIWIPDFVDYSSPGEIWRGYAAEAARREGRELSPPEVDRYWKGQAESFIRQNPGRVLKGILGKAPEILLRQRDADQSFAGRGETGSRPFCGCCRRPRPGCSPWGWRASRGWPSRTAAGASSRRRSCLHCSPSHCFLPRDRFRFHAMAVLALCSGIWMDQIVQSIRLHRRRQALAFAAAAGLVGGVSVALGGVNPVPPIHWDHIVWGYIKMGSLTEAQILAERIAKEQPGQRTHLGGAGVYPPSCASGTTRRRTTTGVPWKSGRTRTSRITTWPRCSSNSATGSMRRWRPRSP